MCKVILECNQFGHYELTLCNSDGSDGPSVYFQSDWEYPGLASSLGWSPCHNSTDGTIDCPECGTSTGELIASAIAYLDDCCGVIMTTPGVEDYFTVETF